MQIHSNRTGDVQQDAWDIEMAQSRGWSYGNR